MGTFLFSSSQVTSCAKNARGKERRQGGYIINNTLYNNMLLIFRQDCFSPAYRG